MKAIWRYYEFPLWFVGGINWLVLYASSEYPVYQDFWIILAFFTIVCAGFAYTIQRAYRSTSIRFFKYFIIGKIAKFFLTIIFLLILFLRNSVDVMNTCVTAGLLFLTSLVVDTLLFLRYAQKLSNPKV